MGESAEAVKLQKHLNLLRQEYVKLQNKNLELESKLALASAASGDVEEDSFFAQLMKIANDLYDKETYTDVTVIYSGKKVRSHKIILAARSDCWCDQDLVDINEITLDDVSVEVGNTLIKWIYTDKADIKNDEAFIMDLVRAANRYKLRALRARCERMLMSSVSVSNCIRFYQTAEDIGAESLKKYCAEIIANHWDDLQTKDFEGMSAPLLYDMFKAKSNYPLHFAVRHHREDIVFLYLIEFNLQLPGKLNEVEPATGLSPLQIALCERQDSIAQTLCQHNCDVNSPDSNGQTLLHKAIAEGDDYAAMFLIEHGADVQAINDDNETVLHLAASYKPLVSGASGDGVAIVARLLLDKGVNINAVDKEGRTAIHRAVAADNQEVFSVLLADQNINLEIRDKEGNVVLWFAILSSKTPLQDDTSETSYAARLVKLGSSSDAINPITGDSLLHMSASLKNESAGLFLIDHGAQVNHTNNQGESPLHIAAKNGLVKLVDKLLKSGANPNTETIETEALKTRASARQMELEKLRRESKHRLIMLEQSKAMKRCKELRETRKAEDEKKAKKTEKDDKAKRKVPKQDSEETNPFLDEGNILQEDSSSNPFLETQDENNPFMTDEELNPFLEGGTGSFFDEMAAAGAAAMALTSPTLSDEPVKTHGVASNTNRMITTFDGRIDVNAIQSPTQVDTFDFDNMHISELDINDGLLPDVVLDCWNKTALHLAVQEKHEDVVKSFVNQADNASRGLIGGRLPMVPDLNAVDSEDQSVLWIALSTKQYTIARLLIDAEVDLNKTNKDNQTLLHCCIARRDLESSLFLLECGADINMRNKEDMTPLQMAIHLHLTPVVDALCKCGVDVNISDANGNTPLLIALKSKQKDIAESLVTHGADTTAWKPGINNCSWTLLHRAIYESDEETACFLIKHGCDVNSPRKPGDSWETSLEQKGSEAWDGLTPLHLSCAAGQDQVVQCLVEQNADVNTQDSEGRSPIHIAIKTKNPIITSILLSHPEVNFGLKDRLGQTPFVVAMSCRDNEAAAAILAREPSSAEQFDNKGRNYLHVAVSNVDVDSVLFLISIEVDVNSRIQDGSHRTPLHIAVPTGSEIIVRHLLLAGADVNAVDKDRKTPLSIAAKEDKAALLEILIQNNANPDIVDGALNNPLHVACQYGNMAAVRVLLTESHINAEAYNGKGQNPLHVLACYSRDNAAAIFDLFRQTMPNYPIDALDIEENTAIFLAYTNGAVGLCCALLKFGARLGTMNKQGVSVFNAPVATKKLLFRLLDLLNTEPAWSDGPNCHECGQKFNVTTRKHHCRHCGRLLCSKCSSQQMPILKYELSKPVRVCQICFEFLTSGML